MNKRWQRRWKPQWREVCNGYYRVSTHGQVESCHRGGWNRMNFSIRSRSGHCCLSVYWYNEKYEKVVEHLGVATLVLRAFGVPPPLGKHMALHKNDIPTDNWIGNLYWGDHNDNGNDRRRNGGRGKYRWRK